MSSQTDYPLIFERSQPGRRGVSLPASDVPRKRVADLLPSQALRDKPPALPEVSEVDVIRHYTGLSRRNHGVDNGFYPLGSCTMKYNPKINEDMASLPGFTGLHPYTPEELSQGALKLMYELEQYLSEIAGVARTTLQPAAGAHGELTGMLIVKAYHRHKGQDRRQVIVPDSAHGTNPASAAMCGFDVVTVKSDATGGVDLEELRRLVGPNTAALMLTNPSTLGLFEKNIAEIARIVHDAGGLLYYDGANANAICGISRPGDMGFDIVHFNLHKTFSTPHGGGGPGAGSVGVSADLVPFLPRPLISFDGNRYGLDYSGPLSIGRVRTFYANFGVLVKAYTYIRMLGPDGLVRMSKDAVLNANYVMNGLRPYYHIPYPGLCQHEFVASAVQQKKHGVRALDVAKRLLDFGTHPPTIYFPLIVEEALMIEPTETESKETLDRFISVMAEIAREAELEPEKVQNAPYTTPVGRLDETRAARHPDLAWRSVRKEEDG